MRRGQIKNINFGIKIYENEKDTCSDLKKKRNKNHVSMMFEKLQFTHFSLHTG